MKTLNDILSKLKFDRESDPMEAHQQVLDLFAVSGWLEFEGNESVFNEYAKFWQWCREKSQNNTVFVSEYNAPDDFECVWQKRSKCCYQTE